MIDESCEVPREDLDDGFNPCRKQVVENGELCQYAHMYDVMNERYDREEDTSYLNSVKRDKITSTTPVLLAGNNTQIYANSTNGEGRVNMLPSSAFNNPDNHTEASIPSAKAVADYVSSRYIPVEPTRIPPDSDLNEYKTSGNYAVESNTVVPSIINKPVNLTTAFNVYVFPVLVSDYYIGQQLSTFDGAATYYRYYDGGSKQWSAWTLLYPTSASTVPNPLPVDQGGTGAQTAQGGLANLLPHTTSEASATGALVYDVDSDSTYLRAISGESSGNQNDLVDRAGIHAMIDAAVANHIASSVANNDLLPTNALMIDYVDTHSMDTPPDKFSFAVSPFPTGTWEGEMNINVVPVFSVNIGTVEYVIARVYGTKTFNYTGTADNIKLFSSLEPVGDYTSIFSNSTNIPLTLNVNGRSYTAGTYGFTPNGSAANLSLNYQAVSSVFSFGSFNISNNLKCVFGEGTKTPGVSVTVNCMALMWRSLK